MPLYNNQSGFKPSGNTLIYWTLLPQVSSSFNKEEIPPLFGEFKNLRIYYILVILLIIVELILMFVINNEGVSWYIIGALSLIDFGVACGPHLFYETKPFGNKSMIDSGIYIEKRKIQIDGKIPAKFKKNKVNYMTECNDNLKKYEGEKAWNKAFKILIAFVLVFLAFWKLYSYWDVFGNDIFVEPTGRFTICVVVAGLFIHIFCTKIVVFHVLSSRAFRKQQKEFERGQHIDNQEHPKELDYFVPYVGVKVDNSNQKIAQLENGIKVYDIKGFDNIFIFYQGLLLDHEISMLYTHQADKSAKEAVIAAGKEIQLSQIQ